MDRITGTNTDVVSGKRRFRDRNLPGGVRGTIMRADYENAMMEELVGGLVERAGLTPDNADWTQVWQALQRLFANRAYAEYRTWAALSAAIPVDDTIPQFTEGTQILSATLTPRSITSRLRVRYFGFAACDSVGALGFSSALFLNGGANAIRAVTTTISDNQNLGANFIEHEYVPGVLTAQTITVRVGAQNGLLYLNGASTRYFGGTAAATLLLEEIPA